MQIVIDLPDDIYSIIVKQYRKDKELQTRDNLYKAIANGTPLPKGHGRLIDGDEVDDAIYKCFEGIQCYDGTGYDIYSDSKVSIDKTPTIIEADKEDK